MSGQGATARTGLGRRGFLGVVAGGAAAAASAQSAPTGGWHAPFEEARVVVGGVEARLLLPARPSGDAVWLLAAGTAEHRAAGQALDAGAAVVLAARAPSSNEEAARLHLMTRAGGGVMVSAAGDAAARAVELVRDRVLPRVTGLHLRDPGHLDAGPGTWWAGRRLRVAGPAGEVVVAPLLRFATEASWTPDRSSADAVTTLARWRTRGSSPASDSPASTADPW